MKVLLYNELNAKKIPNFTKFKAFIESDDFKSADVKKVGDNLYRARLNISDRLLFSLYKHSGSVYALVIEYIKNHEYANSRFMRHVADIDEHKIPTISAFDEQAVTALTYLNSNTNSFNLLDKIISFDDNQQTIYTLPPPLIIIGSAGSGKTALTLEKMKQAVGDVLYVTQSAYLVKNSRDLYFTHHYDNDNQHVDFLSFQEFLETIKIPEGSPITFIRFKHWFSRYRQHGALKDAHKVFEEFRGVLTGSIIDKPFLSREDYLNLGVKRSIFLEEERPAVYELFEKYLQFLKDDSLYDSNIVSYHNSHYLEPRYDFVIVDEVQDLTNIQLYLILKALRNADDFILCGDSNQIVHPNFFSWANIKSLFYQQDDLKTSDQLMRVLNTNYRNAPELTDVANRILKIKNLRFGSIDKESHYLITSNAHNKGEVLLLKDEANIREELNSKTKTSTLFAVIVMNDDQKIHARQYFNTPLIFTIQEAKGLEYENIVLYNFVSQEDARYREIAKGVTTAELEQELTYSRHKNRADKSGEVYKFYINSLYVALTRAIKNLYWIENTPQHDFLSLLNLRQASDSLELTDQNSSLDAWRQEARKLELQGKQEQAERIREEILQQTTPTWEVMSCFDDILHTSGDEAIPSKFGHISECGKQEKFMLFEYSLIYDDLDMLYLLKMDGDFKPANNPVKGIELLTQKHYQEYTFKKPDQILKKIAQYGLEFRNPFNHTPLMAAAWIGNVDIINTLCELGADKTAVDAHGLTAFQIALSQATRNEVYAKKKLPYIYDALVPDSINFKLDNKLLKLDSHQMEFFVMNLMIAMFYQVKPSDIHAIYDYDGNNSGKDGWNHYIKDEYTDHGGLSGADSIKGFSTQSFIDAIKHIPTNILPERRRTRAYLSSILSSHERASPNKYSKKLFYRLKRGVYLFNPELILTNNFTKRTAQYLDRSELTIYDYLQAEPIAYWLELLINDSCYVMNR